MRREQCRTTHTPRLLPNQGLLPPPPPHPTTGTVHFVRTACPSVEAVLPREVVGQELALGQLTDAVCHHLAQRHPRKPLVISVHGPPGVGKTYSHLWLARALYNAQPSASLQCPGLHCRGYKVRPWARLCPSCARAQQQSAESVCHPAGVLASHQPTHTQPTATHHRWCMAWTTLKPRQQRAWLP